MNHAVTAAGPAIRTASGELWVSDRENGDLVRVSAAKAVTRLPLPGGLRADALAADASGGAWFADATHGALGHLGSNGDARLVNLAAGTMPQSLSVGPDNVVWFATKSAVFRLDASASKAVAVTTWPAGLVPAGIAATAGALWVSVPSSGSVVRLSTSGARVYPSAKVRPPIVAGSDGRAYVFVGDTTVVRLAADGSIARFDYESALCPYKGCQSLDLIAAGSDGVYVYDAALNFLKRIDPRGNQSNYTAADGGGWMVSDGHDGVWIGGGDGVKASVSQNGVGHTSTYVTFGNDDFVRRTRYLQPKKIVIAGKTIWLIAENGDTDVVGTLTDGHYRELTRVTRLSCASGAPDGSLWLGFNESGATGSVTAGNLIGRLTADGVMHRTPIPDPYWAQDIAPAGDGTMWVAESTNADSQPLGKLARLGPDLTMTDAPWPFGARISPEEVRDDGRGGIYVRTADATNRITRYSLVHLSRAGKVEATVAPSDSEIVFAVDDGKVWYGWARGSKITVAGSGNRRVMATPQLTDVGDSFAARSDTLWFLPQTRVQVDSITTDGAIATYALAPGTTAQYPVIAGDGSTWFVGNPDFEDPSTIGTFRVHSANAALGRIDGSGHLQQYVIALDAL